MTEEVPESYESATYLSEIEQQFISDMGDMVANHEVRLEALEEKAEKPKVPRDWITRNRQVRDWEQLAVWVDWLNANYSMPHGNRVPQCWPAHPGLVHVLAGLRAAWRAAVLTDETSKEQGNAIAAFHDYHLFPFFNRLANPLIFPCVKASSHREDTEHTATDRELFPSDLSDSNGGEDDDQATQPDEGDPAPDRDDPLPEPEDAAGSLEDDDEWWKNE